MVEENVENTMEEPELVTPETTQTPAFAVYTRHFLDESSDADSDFEFVIEDEPF